MQYEEYCQETFQAVPAQKALLALMACNYATRIARDFTPVHRQRKPERAAGAANREAKQRVQESSHLSSSRAGDRRGPRHRILIYPVHLRPRKSSGDMTRKLSVMLSQLIFCFMVASSLKKTSRCLGVKTIGCGSRVCSDSRPCFLGGSPPVAKAMVVDFMLPGTAAGSESKLDLGSCGQAGMAPSLQAGQSTNSGIAVEEYHLFLGCNGYLMAVR